MILFKKHLQSAAITQISAIQPDYNFIRHCAPAIHAAPSAAEGPKRMTTKDLSDQRRVLNMERVFFPLCGNNDYNDFLSPSPTLIDFFPLISQNRVGTHGHTEMRVFFRVPFVRYSCQIFSIQSHLFHNMVASKFFVGCFVPGLEAVGDKNLLNKNVCSEAESACY